MLTPTSGTLADYNAAILNGNTTHARLVFPVQNITLTDDDISADGGITITDILNGDTDLTFGKAVCKELKVSLLNGSVFTGFDWTEEFHADFGVEINGTTNWVTVGYFTGSKPDRTVNTEIIEFTAYDRMTKFDILADEYLDTITYPATMSSIYSGLCTYVGITSTSGSEITYAMNASYSESPFVKGITCRALLAMIAEANGCYAKITSDGKVKLITFVNQTSNYAITSNHYFNVNGDESPVTQIALVKLKDSEDDTVGLVYPVGNSGETYNIVDNYLLLDMTATARTNTLATIYSRVSAYTPYYPVTVDAIGNWMVETGDIIKVTTNNRVYSMHVYTRTLHWNGGCRDVYERTGNIHRTDMTEAVMNRYAEGGRLSNKYTVRSGVDITDEGVTISGGKFLKLISGGVFDLQSTNFVIDSVNEHIDFLYSTDNVKCTIDKYGIVRTLDFLNPYDNATYRYSLRIGDKLVGAIGDLNEKGLAYVSLGSENYNNISYPMLLLGLRTYSPVFNDYWQISRGYRHDGTTEDMTIEPSMTGCGCIGTRDNPFREANFNRIYGAAVKNNTIETNEGYVLDARQGKALNDSITTINNRFTSMGTAADPVTDLSTIPLGFVGNVVLAASVSPSGVLRAHSLIKIGTNISTRYTIIATDQYDYVSYTYDMYEGTSKGWEQIVTTHIDTSTAVTNLSSIPVNSQGRIKLDSSVSPISSSTITVNYSCIGNSTSRTLKIYHTQSNTEWTNSYNSSSWIGWNINVESDQTITIEKSSSKTFTIPNNYVCLLSTWSGSATTLSSLYYVIGSTSTTNPVVKEIAGATYVTVTSSNGTVTVSNSSTAYAISVKLTFLNRLVTKITVS